MKYNLQEIMMYAVDGVKYQIREVEETIEELEEREQTEQDIQDLKRCEIFIADLEERLRHWTKLDDFMSPWEDAE